jgi:hypothetical protein
MITVLVALLLSALPLAAQTATLPRLGVNISRSFVYTCQPGDPTCSPYVEYSGIPAYAYTDSRGQRTAFANWVRDQALPALKTSGLSLLRIFFSPGGDMACQGCGYSGSDLGRPYLLTRGSPYVSGQSFGTAAEPRLQPWVYSNLKMFFQDAAASELEIDLVLQWDENYGFWTEPSGTDIFVGYPALREIWLNSAAALVDSGAPVLQIEPYQEQQFFGNDIEHHPVSPDYTPGMIQSRLIPPGDWGNKARGQYAEELMDAMLAPLQNKYPQLAGRIFPGLELRAEAAGACNIGTYKGWGDGPWSTTDVQSYYSYVASRNLVFPWTMNVHRYVGADLNGNPEETVTQVRQVFDDLYAFHSGDTQAAATRCAKPAVSPAPFSSPPLVILGETNSDAVGAWDGLNTVTNGYTSSRLAQWLGGGYNHTLLMPWFFGVGADPWDPESAAKNIHE